MTNSVFNHTEYEIQEERSPGNWSRFDYDCCCRPLQDGKTGLYYQ